MTPPSRSVALGSPGNFVRQNIAALRRELKITGQDLADRTGAGPHGLGRSAISEIERGDRRVDVDDLVTIALALGVAPNRLLAPTEPGTVRAGTDLSLSPASYANWLTTGQILDAPTAELKARINELVQRANELGAHLNSEGDAILQLEERLASEGLEDRERAMLEKLLESKRTYYKRERESHFDMEFEVQELKLILNGGHEAEEDDGDY